VPTVAYLLLSLPVVQNKVRVTAENELTNLLAMPVSIESVGIAPFNRLVIRGVTVTDSLSTDTVAVIRRLDAGVKLSSLLRKGSLTIDYAAIIGAGFYLKRETPESPINAQPMFDALKGDGKKRSSNFVLAVNTIVIRQSAFRYDVESQPIINGKFDKSHIGVSDFRADISLRKLEIPFGVINLRVQRIAFEERCGFAISDLHFNVNAEDSTVEISDFVIKLPDTRLSFNDIQLRDVGLKDLSGKYEHIGFDVGIKKGSYITLSNFAPFFEPLSALDKRYPISFNIKGVLGDCVSVNMRVSDPSSPLYADFSAEVRKALCMDSIYVKLRKMEAEVASVNLSPMIRMLGAPEKLLAYPKITVRASGDYAMDRGNLNLDMGFGNGYVIKSVSRLWGRIPSDCRIESGIDIAGLNLENINGDIGDITASVEADISLNNGLEEALLDIKNGRMTYKGYEYQSVVAQARYHNKNYEGELTLYDPNARIFTTVTGSSDGDLPYIKASTIVSGLNLSKLNLVDAERVKDYELSFVSDAKFAGKNLNMADADIKISNLSFISINPEDVPLKMNNLSLELNGSDEVPNIHLRSDFIDADVTGAYSFTTIGDALSDILHQPFPTIFRPSVKSDVADVRNNFDMAMTLKYSEQLIKFLNLPVSVIYPIKIDGYLCQDRESFGININAPYLLQKNKIIENTTLALNVDSVRHALNMNITTSLPTKDGLNNVALNSVGEYDRLDTDISWIIDRKNLFKGDVSLSAAFARDDDDEKHLSADVRINPSALVFNDSVWYVEPAKISISKDRYGIEGLEVSRSHQFVTANGVISKSPEDSVTLSLLNFNLDYLFETLGLDNVRLGGDATGVFHASNVLSGEPRVLTDNLKVENISFNKTIFGNADIVSHWDTEKKGVMIDAVIAPSEADSLKTFIYGGIFPMADSLDLHFDANKIDASFLMPYMEAFASSVSGKASGKARIFGNFKYIDLTGDILAEDFSLGLGVTNTKYTVKRDSIHIVPGRIPLDDITIYDVYGNTGRLNGYVSHKFFKDASFNISMTDANKLLCFNITPEINPVWNGRIFADGTLFLRGEPGKVDIEADLRTAPESYFNLTLDDVEDAGEYHFISFRNAAQDKIGNNVSSKGDTVPDIISYIRSRVNAVNPPSHSAYNLNLQVDITPDAMMTLIMDPQTPDRIRSRGHGNMRIVYTSDGVTAPEGSSDIDENMRIYGSYEVTKGSYYFTLQDIIVKDFIIKPGSSITFSGNPDAALLNLSAYYLVNANLTDLDESFAQDKDLNRTNVPVHALLNVAGDIRQPEISFNIEFPTLNSDIDRKVRSIISTDDMMSTQIIYLLALNRFYTPEYMSASTKSNEFVSVASSTLSSRLAGILGTLSDTWTVAPNVRSGRGDFSDVEFDVALSSSLLNNRLLFNGNFGYRDNALNANRFVGDFDIEYLLNKSGNIRLKAYNRYNDQNFYLKTATTTQGVGVMYKIDFDRLFNFNKKRIKPATSDSVVRKNIIIIK